MKRPVKTIFLQLIAVALVQSLMGQSYFEKQMNVEDWDWPVTIDQTYSDGFIIGGYSEVDSSGSIPQMQLIKVNSLGDTIWSRKVPNQYPAYLFKVLESNDSGFVGVGSECTSDPCTTIAGAIIKYDRQGSLIWRKQYPNHEFYSIIENPNGNLVIVGASVPPPNDRVAIFLMETDAFGDSLWTRNITYDTICGSWDIHSLGNGNYSLVGGASPAILGAGYPILIEADSIGNPAWIKSYNGYFPLGAKLPWHLPFANNGFLLMGTQRSLNGDNDLIFVRVDSLGDTLWTRTIDSGKDEYMGVPCLGSNGSAMFSGSFGDSLIFGNINPNGQILWQRFSSLFPTEGSQIVPASNGDWGILGATYSGTQYSDVFLMKVNNQGVVSIGESYENLRVSLSFFPNPVDAVGKIVFESEEKRNRAGFYSVTNSAGVPIQNGFFEGDSISIDFRLLPSGLYQVKVTDSSLCKEGSVTVLVQH